MRWKVLTAGAVTTLTTLFLMKQCGLIHAPGTVPVNYVSGLANSTSMKPIETSLYDYVEGRGGHYGYIDDFKVTSKPPLRFAFPAAYYWQELNMKGGPQHDILLRIDPYNFHPYELSKNDFKAENYSTPDKYREVINPHEMSVQIFANTNQLPITLTSRDFASHYEPSGIIPETHPVFEQNIGNFIYMSWIDYSFRNIPRKKSLKFGNMDMYKTQHYAYPDPYDSEPVKFIECDFYAPRRNVNMLYLGKRVNIVIDKKLTPEIGPISRKVIKFLDKYNIDLQSKTPLAQSPGSGA